MEKTKKSQGKLARYVNTPQAMAVFRRHYGVPDDVYLEYRFWEDALTGEPGDLILPLVAIIEGGVRFPIDPLLADFLDYFRLSPSQISPNIFRIVMGVVELNRWLGLNLTVHDIIATYTLRTTQHEAYSLRPRDVNNTLVNSLPNTNKEMTDDFLLVRGAWYYPGHRCPTVDGRPVRFVWTTTPIPALHSSFFAHDIRHKAGINLERLLLPVRTQAEASDPVLPVERKRKRKGPSKEEASRSETLVTPEVLKVEASLAGVDTLPSANETDAVQGSLELGDRYQRLSAELENSLKVATRSFDFRNEAERLRRDVEAYRDQVRIAVLKKDEAVLKVEETEDLLHNALEANSKAEDRFKALEADIAAREKAAFDRGQVEAQKIMTNQLPGVYNEAFQQGWKALYSWPESDDMPQLPPRDNLPYLGSPYWCSGRKSYRSPCLNQTKRPVHPPFEDLIFFLSFVILFLVDPL
uniref:Uncharacterized protein n=1 Tax=Fagus sylvatica TaxID=28930 RepID=A0A2N9GR11_FAGSY